MAPVRSQISKFSRTSIPPLTSLTVVVIAALVQQNTPEDLIERQKEDMEGRRSRTLNR